MKVPESFWAAVGKIGAVAGVLATILGLWTHYSAPRGDLIADLRFGPQFWPPDAKAEREAMLNLVESERLAQVVAEAVDEKSLADTEAVIGEFAHRLRNDINEINLGGYTRLGGYWIADVRNEGDLSVDGVAINLPDAVVAVTIPGRSTILGGDAKLARVDSGVVSLGTLRPNGKVRVIAWTIVEPSEFSPRDVVLSHQGGVGSLAVYSVRPPIAVSLGNNWFLLLPFAWLLVSVGVPLLLWYRQQRGTAMEAQRRRALPSEVEQASEGEATEKPPANSVGGADA